MYLLKSKKMIFGTIVTLFGTMGLCFTAPIYAFAIWGGHSESHGYDAGGHDGWDGSGWHDGAYESHSHEHGVDVDGSLIGGIASLVAVSNHSKVDAARANYYNAQAENLRGRDQDCEETRVSTGECKIGDDGKKYCKYHYRRVCH